LPSWSPWQLRSGFAPQLREGEPTKAQAIFEWGYDQLRALIKSNVSDDALFVIRWR